MSAPPLRRNPGIDTSGLELNIHYLQLGGLWSQVHRATLSRHLVNIIWLWEFMSWQKLQQRSQSAHIGPLALNLDPAGCLWCHAVLEACFVMLKLHIGGIFILKVQIIIEKKNPYSHHEEAPLNITNTYKQCVYFGFIAAVLHLLMAADVCCPCRDSADGSLVCCVSNTILT